MVLANLIGGFVAILVGVTLMPTIADQVNFATGFRNSTLTHTNLTSPSIAIVELTTIFFALGIMSAGVALAVSGLRQAGLV